MSLWALTLSAAMPAHAEQMPKEQTLSLTRAVEQVLQRSGTPGASAGILQHGAIVYSRAFGAAVLGSPGSSRVPTDVGMAFPIGSNSKLFTATCVMLLKERGLLGLDDPVSRWFPELTRSL